MKKDNRVELSIIIIIITIFLIIAGISYRNNSYTETWVVCNSQVTESYHEEMKFRFDVNDKLYGFYREEKITGSKEMLETNYNQFNAKRESIKSNLNENFKYEIKKDDSSVTVNTYIGVKVYPDFFNKYFAEKKITSDISIDDINTKLTNAGFECKKSRK